jgi:hypothetical protein
MKMRSGIVFLAALAAMPLLGQQVSPPAPGPVPERGGGRGPGRNGLGGATAGFVQNATYDKEPPVLPTDLKSGGILIFTKTSGFRDEPAIEASNATLATIAAERGWPFFITENGAVMNADQLSKFKLVIWNNASGDPLTADQRAAFKA